MSRQASPRRHATVVFVAVATAFAEEAFIKTIFLIYHTLESESIRVRRHKHKGNRCSAEEGYGRGTSPSAGVQEVAQFKTQESDGKDKRREVVV
jgi:hypothetical protein